MIDRNLLGDKDITYNQQHTVIKMKQLEFKQIKMLCSVESYEEAEEFLRTNKANIVDAKDERVLAEVDWKGKKWKVLIHKNDERNFDTSCDDISEINYPLCTQKVIVLLQLLNGFTQLF
jgi:non-specific serine/threonine protein kinase